MRQRIGLFMALVFLSGGACRRAPVLPKKMAITTSSAEARAAFLKARDLASKLRTQEAQALLDQAIRADPNLAVAHLLRAQTSTSTKEFFDHLAAAVSASGKASESEQWLIRAQEAEAGGDTRQEGEYLAKLVAACPDDEWARWSLGLHDYAIQQNEAAIAEFQKTVQMAPDFAPAYNNLGYALRQGGKDKEAEAAFRKYIDLIPNEPNPYDSLAELLLKMGRFKESIEQYRKAISLDPRFLSAYRGVAANFMYQDRYRDALAQLRKELDQARDVGEREQALLLTAVCHADQGGLPAALETLSKRTALAEKQGDKATMAADSFSRGDLLLNAGRVAEASAEYVRGLQLAQQSTLPDRAKKSLELEYHGRIALVAAAKKDFENAQKEADIMRAGFEGMGNPNEMRSVHEALGIVALRQSNYDEAISQLMQADLQSPYAMFHLANAYAGKRDRQKARAYYRKAAQAYILPDLRYAMVRKAARRASLR